jgi:FtsZ-interacting cell division protein ZipA
MRDRYDAFKAEGPLLNECADDIKIKCPHLENGFGLITACLLKEKAQSTSSFTPSCEQALSAVKTTPHAEKHPTDELTKHVEVEKKAEHAQTGETQPTLTHEEQHIVNSVKEESQAEKDARNEKIAKKFADEDPTPAKDSVVTEKKKQTPKPTAEQEPVVVEDPTLAKSSDSEDLEAKLREANARIKLAEEAAAHASAQTRNFVLLLMFCATSFGITRKGSRRRMVFMFKKLRLSQKGAQL